MRILVDTSVRVDFFNGHPSRQAETLAHLIREEADLVTCGLIVSEVLQGLRQAKSLANIEKHFREMDWLSPKEPNTSAWEAYVRATMRGYAPLTWDAPAGETSEQRIMRATVLGVLGVEGQDPEVIAGARSVAEQYMTNPSSVDAVIADRALPIVAINGDEALFNQVLEHIKSAPTPEIARRYRDLIPLFRDPKLIARAVDYIYSDQVRSQDLPSMAAELFFNPAAKQTAWNAAKAHWDMLIQKIPTAIGAITGSTATFCDAASKADVQSFFATHPPGAGERGLKRAMEAIDTCIAFKAAEQASFNAGVGVGQ